MTTTSLLIFVIMFSIGFVAGYQISILETKRKKLLTTNPILWADNKLKDKLAYRTPVKQLIDKEVYCKDCKFFEYKDGNKFIPLCLARPIGNRCAITGEYTEFANPNEWNRKFNCKKYVEKSNKS